MKLYQIWKAKEELIFELDNENLLGAYAGVIGHEDLPQRMIVLDMHNITKLLLLESKIDYPEDSCVIGTGQFVQPFGGRIFGPACRVFVNCGMKEQ